MTDLNIDREQLETLCREYHVHRLAIFGSVLRGEERPDSDLDMLVEFEPNSHVGWGMFGLENKLSDLIGKKVDLNTAGFLHRGFREEVVREAQTIYATTPPIILPHEWLDALGNSNV